MSTSNQYKDKPYEHYGIYKAVVVDQRVTKVKDEPTVILTVKPVEKLKNAKVHDSGFDPIPEELQNGKDIFLNMRTRAEQSFKDLAALGFKDVKYIKLDPKLQGHVSLVDKECYVRMNWSEDKKNPGQDKDWWNITRLNVTTAKDLQDQYDRDYELLEAAFASANGEEELEEANF